MGPWGSRITSHGPFAPSLLSTEGFQSWMWRGLTFLLPFLFCGHVSTPGVCGYLLLWADPQEQVFRPLPHSPAISRLGLMGSQGSDCPWVQGGQRQGPELALRLLRPRVPVSSRGFSVSQGSCYQKLGVLVHPQGFPTWSPGELGLSSACSPPAVLAALQRSHTVRALQPRGMQRMAGMVCVCVYVCARTCVCAFGFRNYPHTHPPHTNTDKSRIPGSPSAPAPIPTPTSGTSRSYNSFL